MTTNVYPGIGKITNGRDYNFYQKVSVVATDFGLNAVDGQQPDIIIPFPTQTVMFLNEDSTNVVEYSFNGNTVHGELDPSKPSKGLTFDNRSLSLVWFRVKSGSTSPVVIRIDAWSTR